jgi:gluconate 2-dehydrogenase gamma chain
LGGKTFSQLDQAQQEALLKAAEAGKLELENIPPRNSLPAARRNAHGVFLRSPSYGGNKNMAAWRMIGYPGARADYTDWVEVRDRPYPLPPVDLAGKRG